MMRAEDAKKLLIRDYDPFLSLVRPIGEDISDLDEEFLALKKSFEDQTKSGAITTTNPKERELISLKSHKLPHVIINTDIGSNTFRYRLSTFGRLSQKLHDPVVVQWLQSDFERDEDSSLPRSLMYEAYLEYCRVNNHCMSNQACFGKSVRNVFPFLQTRRIGHRGNSKYHYFGIRSKPDSPTAEYLSKKQTGFRKCIRSVKTPIKLESFSQEPKAVSVPTIKIKTELEANGDYQAVVKILIPDFPTHQTTDVSKNVLVEAYTLIDCMEKYAFDVLRVIMKSSENFDMQEVFNATAENWITVSQILQDDAILTNPDILALLTECDIQIQKKLREILLPDLTAPITEEKSEKLRTVFAGQYLKEMMTVMHSAPDKVKSVKRKVYKKFCIEMLERLSFMRLFNKVGKSFENVPVSRLLQKAITKLDVDCLVTKCRFAFAMKKSDFMVIDKTIRKDLTTFQDSLNNGFHLSGCLNWVRAQVLDQIKLDKQHEDCKDRMTVTLLCFSYAVNLIIGELLKHFPLQLQGGLRCLQVLTTDYVSYSVQDEMKTSQHALRKLKKDLV